MRQVNENIDILAYLPPIIADIREITAYAAAQNPELELLWQGVRDVFDDQFLYTMTENGIVRWENIIGIVPKGTDTLEDRRFRIISKLNASFSYTYRKMEEYLNGVLGADGYTMNYDKDIWTLTIKVALTRKKQYDEVLDFIKNVIPMNILLDYDLLYNKHSTLGLYTHRMLSAYTHNSLRNDAINN